MYEPTKILYSNLNEADKKKVEEVYQTYRTKTQGHWWRGTNETPIAGGSIDCSVKEIVENGKINTANAWANFALCKIESNPTNFSDVKKMFDSYYRPAAEDANYAGKPIAEFDKFLDIQKNSWLAAGQAVFNLQPNQDSKNNQESELDNQSASRSTLSR